MKLALLGGFQAIDFIPDSYQWIDEIAIEEVSTLLRSQRLSGFLAQPTSDHLGGLWVRSLEEAWINATSAKNAVAFNSWTSGLEAAFLALDLPDSAEVIVPPWTMSATVAAIIHANLTPVFADIDPHSFTIDPAKAADLITSQSAVICAVDIFGRPCNFNELRQLANTNGLHLVIDSAQCPGGTIDGVHPSTVADIGGYSLNRHKHVQSGEGGVAITSSSQYAERLRALRNHGEIAASSIQLRRGPIVGHNWRLGEIEALLAHRQMLQLDFHIQRRRQAGQQLVNALSGFHGIQIAPVPDNMQHDYYILGMTFSQEVIGLNRNTIALALKAEGLDIVITEYAALHKLPAFADYKRGDLTVTDRLNQEAFLGLYLCGYDFSSRYIDGIVECFHKVWESLDELKIWQS